MSYTGPKIILYIFLPKMFNCSLSLFVSVQVSDAYVKVLSIIVFVGLNFSFTDMFLFLKNFCNIKYILLAFLFFLASLFGYCYLHEV